MNETNFPSGMIHLSSALEKMTASSAAQAKDALKRLSSGSKEIGLEDHDFLLCIGEGRDALDPFGIFCMLYGRMMKYIGTVPTVAIAVVSLLALIEWLVRRVDNVYEWFKTMISQIPTFTIKAAKSVFGFDAVEEDASSAIGRMSAQGLRGFVYGLLPAPIAGAMGAVLGLIGEFGGETIAYGGGIDRPAVTPGGTPSSISPPTRVSVGKKKKGIKKFLSWLVSDEDTAELTGEDVAEIAEALEISPSEVIELVSAKNDDNQDS
jgi:hypothetical protein